MNLRKDGIFPDEIIIQILSRLPIRSLFRFKTVCKLWYLLSSDKYFVQLYNELAAKTSTVLVEVSQSSDSKPSLICVDSSRGVYEFSLRFLNDRVNVRASSNGLLCCSSITEKGVYYVCNPMTREYKLLPRARERPVTRFYPDGEATLVGLASNLSTQNYIVVLAGYHRSFGQRAERKLICFVFDSETSKWRKFVSLQDDQFTYMSGKQVVFVNGAFHWLTGNGSTILVLDLCCDFWKKMSFPDIMNYGSGTRSYLLELDGSLSVIQISDAWMNIWVLKDYEKELWQIVDRVSLRCIRGLMPGIFPISQTAEYVYLATHKQVLVYYRYCKVWKEMYSVNNNSTLPLWFSAHSFRNTIFTCR